jgi:hypothetical protein
MRGLVLPSPTHCALLVATAALRCTAQNPVPAALPLLLESHCVECHAGADAEAAFEIAPLFAVGNVPDEAAVSRLQLAMQRVRSRTMPPPDAGELPTVAERIELVTVLAARIPVAVDARIATIRRLSRTQLEYTIRDLCGVEIQASELLPPDARTYGFDTIGDVASVTPMLFESYLAIAATVTDSMRVQQPPHAVFATATPFREALPPFLERAFRRPATGDELQERLDLHDGARRAGLGEEHARAIAVRSVLASPSFLFRAEFGDGAEPARLSPFELATRLSYLLTSSMPDEALLAAARSSELREPAVLLAHAHRLLAATRGRVLADTFAAQWLRFVDVLTANADFRRYPQIWSQSLRPAFYEEAALLFAEIVREDGSILWLLDCDHTWVDGALAKHYGLADVQGDGFVRVQLPDRRRGGILGTGAMLMVSSYPLRTSPVLRGKWILDQLLDASPPPPPANAGVLPADDDQPDGLTLRARLERHRQDRSCASCHAQIDPLGFALENFDVLGRWRDEVHGKPVDARASLPDGTELDGPIALKDALLQRQAEFARTFANKLLVFAVGRPMTARDEPELVRIAAACEAGDFRFSALLSAMLASPLFTMRDPGGM